MNHISWSHAYTHRLADFDLLSKSSQSNSLGQRLIEECANEKLPFLDFSYAAQLEEELPKAMAKLPDAEHMVLLGIGGSALGARALQKAFFPQQDRPGHTGPWLWIADNIDSLTLEAWMSTLQAQRTVLVVISKSGGTIETMAQYAILRDWLELHLGEGWRQHVLAITDPSSGPLRQEAANEGLVSLSVPEHLGGRYSALSAVGLVPAAFLGIDWKALLSGAKAVTMPLVEQPAFLHHHPAWELALWADALMQKQYSQLIFFSYTPLWSYFGQWFGQLWAESLGKEGKGSTPLPAVGVTDQHSLQQLFLDGPRDKGCLFLSAPNLSPGPLFTMRLPAPLAFLQGKRFGDLLSAEATGTRMALVESGVPLVHITLAGTDEEAGGRLMGLCMAATLLTGWLMHINPLDQPAVELGKRLANTHLGAKGYDTERAALAAFLEKEKASNAPTLCF